MTAGQEAPAAGVAGLIARLVRDVPDYPQPGILFKDITPLLADAGAFDQVVDALAAGHGPVSKVAGIEARGRATTWSTARPRWRCTGTRSARGSGC